ncbi:MULTISPECIES: SDR family NAD(P)-dependent oxidoreductase [unclassified Sphingomonas]|uniref:SDR family NAD(P)-dependent oxidoreductase n=1 Tax=unclassified Sphingomonas TaxID=196159 RepID=UPI0006FCEEE1|nr:MULTISPECIES: SDR family oxidoreductase [unclassified Sphingomonas]KRB78789.1 hypothetical protein ASE00_21410 [Sphingomonas sp. Root710]KRB93699.1 hypothetical protein ASE22_25180 [Sphingomonas sp. Root720]
MAYPEPFDLSGKVAVVTGAAGGLGAAFAAAMAQAGASVALLDLDTEGLAATVADVEKLGKPAIAERCDIACESDVIDSIANVLERFGQIDILINNAGISDPEPMPVHEFPTAHWNKVVSINLTGQFFCAREALKPMVAAGRGKIINVASMWGLAGPSSVAPLPAYAATKGAIVNLTRELALQYAAMGICVNAICPGFFRTALGPYEDPGFLKRITDFTPMGRIADVSEIKGTAIYLASAASDFMTGATIVIDGGCLAK